MSNYLHAVTTPMDLESESLEHEEAAIDVQDVTVSYRSYKEHPATLKELLINMVRKRRVRYYSTFQALSHVSFRVKKGSVFGIIGSNGAGKSTLLKVLAGVLPPTQGTIEVEGSVESLIQLGAGFDADLNAIENIYLNGSLHRQSKSQIQSRVESIIEFAELQEFATTPIRYYSSGMNARLGFSVIVDRKPDILLVDEVLAVGDERFQAKSRKVFDAHIEAGRTVVIVSHSMQLMRDLADEIGLLSKGKLIYRGDPKTAIDMYLDKSYETALT